MTEGILSPALNVPRHFQQAEQRHERSESRVCVNGNGEFSLQTRAVPFNARRRVLGNPAYYFTQSFRTCGFSVGRRHSLARKVEVGRYSADTPNNPRQIRNLSMQIIIKPFFNDDEGSVIKSVLHGVSNQC